MTTVTINPGICGLKTRVQAETDEECMDVTVRIQSACEAVQKMANNLGTDFDAYEVCLTRPGANAFYQYAAQNFPIHAACPVISGIVKCIEAECKLALPCDVQITFD